MKLLIIRLTAIIGIMTLLILIMNSCAKDKDEVNNYVGTWEYESDGYKSIFILEPDAFETQSLFKLENDSIYLYAKSFGDLKIINDSLDLTYNQIEIDTSFTEGNDPDGYLTIYKREDISFTETTKELWHLRYKYEIQGDVMILNANEFEYEFHRVP
jgi:hypothetical protein